MRLSKSQKRVLRTMGRIAADAIQVTRPQGGEAVYCARSGQYPRGPHWRTLSAMERKGLLTSDWGEDVDLIFFYLTPKGHEIAERLADAS